MRILLAAAHQIRRMMQAEKIKSYKEVAVKLNLSPARVSQIMDLLFLSPRIQEEILAGDNEKIAGLTEKDVSRIAKIRDWQKQILNG